MDRDQRFILWFILDVQMWSRRQKNTYWSILKHFTCRKMCQQNVEFAKLVLQIYPCWNSTSNWNMPMSIANFVVIFATLVPCQRSWYININWKNIQKFRISYVKHAVSIYFLLKLILNSICPHVLHYWLAQSVSKCLNLEIS